MITLAAWCRRSRLFGAFGLVLAALALFGAGPAAAQQIETVDPDILIDGDLESPQPSPTPAQATDPYIAPQPVDPGSEPDGRVLDLPPDIAPAPTAPAADASKAASEAAANPTAENTYKKDDLIGAAEGVFGKGAEGLARIIEDLLDKQGEPNGYIVGREGGGAFIFGARYGSGTLYHKVEGQRPVYWRGPSLGVDVGANAANTFVLVYNLFDTEEIFERFVQGEGQAYLIGGFHVSYLRRGDKVLIPVRAGAGLRLGINVGYMKFSKKQNWLPF